MAKPWRTTEVAIAKKYPARYAAALIGRTEKAVEQMKWKLGIANRARAFSAGEDATIRAMRAGGAKHREIAARIGRDEHSTRSRWSKIRNAA